MGPARRLYPVAAAAFAALLAASACTSSAGSTPAASVLGAQATPSTAGAGSAPMTVTIGTASSNAVGTFMTGPTGMALYVFKKDGPDKSACGSSCVSTWPPLLIASGGSVTGPSGATGTFGTFTRDDGSMQVTFNHQPLYYYAGDTTAGSAAGQGMGNLWFVASPAASAASPSEDSGGQPTAAPKATTQPGGGGYGY